MKIARWVWSRGKDGDNIKVLPIAIKVTGSLLEEGLLIQSAELFNVNDKYRGA